MSAQESIFSQRGLALILAAFSLTASVASLADAQRDAAVAERIRPIGQITVSGSEPAAQPAAAAAREPSEVYQSACFACHGTGAAGAPKVGDKAAWADRAAQGIDALLTSAINGKGIMPPRGGNPSVTDEELRAVIEMMLKDSGL